MENEDLAQSVFRHIESGDAVALAKTLGVEKGFWKRESLAKLEKRLEVSREAPETFVTLALRKGEQEMVRMLLKCSASAKKQNFLGRTGYHEAIRLGMVDLALEMLSDFHLWELRDVVSADGRNVVMEACAAGTPEGAQVCAGLVEILKKSNAAQREDLWLMRDGQGRNALHCAALSGSVSCLHSILGLLGAEAMVRAKDRDGNTPAHLAMLAGNKAVLRSLVEEAHASLNEPNLNGLGVVDLASQPECAGSEASRWLLGKLGQDGAVSAPVPAMASAPPAARGPGIGNAAGEPAAPAASFADGDERVQAAVFEAKRTVEAYLGRPALARDAELLLALARSGVDSGALDSARETLADWGAQKCDWNERLRPAQASAWFTAAQVCGFLLQDEGPLRMASAEKRARTMP